MVILYCQVGRVHKKDSKNFEKKLKNLLTNATRCGIIKMSQRDRKNILFKELLYYDKHKRNKGSKGNKD